MKIIISLLFSFMALVACTSEYDQALNDAQRAKNGEDVVFYATIESPGDADAQTKVYADGQMRVLWNKDDQISIFNKNDFNRPFKFMGEDGDNGGTFKQMAVNNEPWGVSDLSHAYAIYPYLESTTIESDGTMNVSLPVTQHYKDRSFGIGANTMVSVTDNDILRFKNAGGYLSFKFYGAGVSVKRISLRGNNHEKLAGNAKIAMSFGGTPVVSMQDDAFEFVTLTCDEPVALNAEADGFTEFWFVLPPTDFTQGFTVTVTDSEGGTFEKSTSNHVTVSRNSLSRMAPVQVVPVPDELEAERRALINFFYAMDGPNWENNTNWCSDQPLGEWFGIYVGSSGHVEQLTLFDNHLNGVLTNDLEALKHLTILQLMESRGTVSNWEALFNLPSLTFLVYGIGDRYTRDLDEYESWLVTIPPSIKNLKNLTSLDVRGIKGPLPAELFEMEELTYLSLGWLWLDGPLPEGFGQLKNLRTLSIQGRFNYLITPHSDKNIKGPIPEDLYDCTNLRTLRIVDTDISGTVSPKISNLKQLSYLNLSYNQLSGTLPTELTELNNIGIQPEFGGALDFRGNHLSGQLPAEFSNWPAWNVFWGFVLDRNKLDYSQCVPIVPDFTATTLDGNTYNSDSYADNELTLYYQWATWCPFSPSFIPILKNLYDKYHEQGMEVVSFSSEDQTEMRSYVAEHGIPGICFQNSGNYYDTGYILGTRYWLTDDIPSIVAFDKNGKMVYYSIGLSDDFSPFVDHWFGNGPDPSYESTDFSADGVVHTLQTASVGAGIDLVLMGDAYSDRLIADGTYADVMNRAMEAFFTEEPYKSFRNCFNVKYVDVVSKNEVYTGETALETWFGEGTTVGGNNDIVFHYAQNALSRDENDALIVVLINRDYYAGTCYMQGYGDGDYGRGLSIAYLPVKSSADIFGQTIRHEAGGHGFAKLADEYAYQENGAVPESDIEYIHTVEPYGWCKNIDFTGNTALVKWNTFIADANFASEGLGCYEGAFTYWTGVWRPTENSIMRDNTGGFNAPSRYAIWYRINKLAYGADWTGTYDDFVAWDLAHRSPAQAPRRDQADEIMQQLPPLAPPVIRTHLLTGRTQ